MSLSGSRQKTTQTTNQTQTNTLSDRAANAIGGQITALQGQHYKPLDASSVNQWMNPFQHDVIDATMAQSAQADAQAQTAQKADFAKASAFGDNRRGIYEAELQGQQSRDRASQLAALNSANYGQALGVAQGQNQGENAYGLSIQQLINQLIGQYSNEGTTTGSGTSKGTTSGFNLGFTYGGS